MQLASALACYIKFILIIPRIIPPKIKFCSVSAAFASVEFFPIASIFRTEKLKIKSINNAARRILVDPLIPPNIISEKR